MRRRERRLSRWDRPIENPAHRLAAWTNMVFVDHGIFRLAYLNLHEVTPDLWRSAQPAPHQIRHLARRGLRTIVNLRGGREFGSFPLEIEACAEAGVALVDLVVRSREAPRPETVAQADQVFAQIAYPALIHCKSGADRAGFASALYLMLRENASAEMALRQLSVRYGHFRSSKTGILDAFFEAYATAQTETGIAFRPWVETVYDPEALTARFRSGGFGAFVSDQVLRRE